MDESMSFPSSPLTIQGISKGAGALEDDCSASTAFSFGGAAPKEMLNSVVTLEEDEPEEETAARIKGTRHRTFRRRRVRFKKREEPGRCNGESAAEETAALMTAIGTPAAPWRLNGVGEAGELVDKSCSWIIERALQVNNGPDFSLAQY